MRRLLLVPLLLAAFTSTASGQIPSSNPNSVETCNVRSNGATGNGITDDTAAIQSCLDRGGRVYVPDGIYLISSASTMIQPDTFGTGLIITRSNTWLELAPSAILKHNAGPPGRNNLLRIMGRKSIETTFTGASVRATSITVANATGITAGQDVVLVSGTDANPIDFEINHVSAAPGTSVNLAHPLENSYPNGSRFLLVAWVKNVRVTGGQWEGNSRARTLIHGDYVQKLTIEHIHGRHTAGDGRCIASTLYSNATLFEGNYCEDIADRGIETYVTTWNGVIRGNTVLRAGIHGFAIHGRHIRVTENLAIGGGDSMSGFAGFHLDSAHHIGLIGNQAAQNKSHGFQTAWDTAAAQFKGNIASANVQRGFDYATAADLYSEGNFAVANGDDGYRFGTGITRALSNLDHSAANAAWGANVLAGANAATLWGFVSDSDATGAVTNAGTNSKVYVLRARLATGNAVTPFVQHVSIAYHLNFSSPAIVPGCVDKTQAFGGAALGDNVMVSASVTPRASFTLGGFVSSADNVTVRWCQHAGAPADPDGGSGATYHVDLWKR